MRVLDKEQSYQNAKKKVEAIKAFYWHLFASIFAMIFVSVVDFVTGSGFSWSLIPIAAILLSLLIHWFVVFKVNVLLGKSWEDRKIEEYIKKEEEREQRKLYQ